MSRTRTRFERRVFLIRKVVSNRTYEIGGDEDRRILPRVDVVPHHRLQGHGAGASARALLQGSARPAVRDRAGAGASAFRHQHVPVLAARPSLSHGRAQRRDQHAARQRQLDGGAAGQRRFRTVRQRHLQAVADLLRRPVRHRLFRQRARIPGARRLFADPRDDDADPGGLGRQSADERGAARVLRISRRDHGAVGRPGGDGVHRRAPDRRDARPQRPAARRAISSPTTASSCSPPKWACCPCRRRASCRSGACSPARCCSSICRSTASSPTTS